MFLKENSHRKKKVLVNSPKEGYLLLLGSTDTNLNFQFWKGKFGDDPYIPLLTRVVPVTVQNKISAYLKKQFSFIFKILAKGFKSFPIPPVSLIQEVINNIFGECL